MIIKLDTTLPVVLIPNQLLPYFGAVHFVWQISTVPFVYCATASPQPLILSGWINSDDTVLFDWWRKETFFSTERPVH